MTVRGSATEAPRVRRKFRTEERPSSPPPEPEPKPKLNAAAVGEVGQRHIADLTGKPIEGITSVQPAESGWVVNVEVMEDRRIPSSGDILALYQVQLDKEGGLQSYRRVRRYKRSNADQGEAF